jgi:DNA polymerase III sliding clamp (beta) subunit (PCNA family)
MMNIIEKTRIRTVNSDMLSKAYAAAALAIPKRGIQPMLNNVLLEANSHRFINLTATDLDTSIEVRLNDVDVDNCASVFLPGKLTLKDSRDFELVDLESIKLIDKDTVLQSINNPGFVLEEYPISLFSFDAVQTVSLGANSAKFINALASIKNFASKYDLYNILGGINLQILDGKLKLAASDGNKLQYVDICEMQGELNITIRKNDIDILLKAYKGLKSYLDTSIIIKTDKNKVSFYIPGQYLEFNMTARLLDGTFPRYMQLVDTSSKPKNITFKYKEFKKACIAAFKTSNEITNLVELKFNRLTSKLEEQLNVEILDPINNIGFDDFTIYF